MHLPFDPAGDAPPPTRAIFAVDDNENDRTLLLQALVDAGAKHPCRFFASGGEMIDGLIAVLKGAPPPLACFLDVSMPGMGGLDVLRWIRLQDALAEIAVVMLSASEDPAHVSEAHHFGAQCYVAKFPPGEQLLEILRKAEEFSAMASGRSAFNLQCNLLLSATQTVS